jgi:hypothetical protein
MSTAAIVQDWQGVEVNATNIEDTIAQLGLSFDWFTPIAGMLYGIMAGCVPCGGDGWEIKKLEKAGIRCHFPVFVGGMVGPDEGEYVFQIERGQLKRAQRLLKRKGM